MNKVLAAGGKVVDWIEVPENRKRLYQALAVLGPVLVAAGLLTGDQVETWLNVVAGLLLLGGGTLATKHTG